MITKILSITIITLIATAALADSGHSHGSHEHQAHAVANAASPSEVMTQIHELQAKLLTTVADKKLGEVHQIAFAIRDLAASLPGMTSPENKVKVETTAKNISAIATALDESGDAGDQAKTEANVKKLDGLLRILETQVSSS